MSNTNQSVPAGPQSQDSQDSQDSLTEVTDDDIAAEYDLSGGMRGKHATAMRAGYHITIQDADGTTEVREVAPTPGTVVLDPDVRKYFSNSEAVNRALRELIEVASRLSLQHEATSDTDS